MHTRSTTCRPSRSHKLALLLLSLSLFILSILAQFFTPSNIHAQPSTPSTLVPVLRGEEPLPLEQIDPAQQFEKFNQKSALPPTSAENHHDSKAEELQGELLTAIGNDDIATATYLLEAGASPDKTPGNSGITPLMLAQSGSMAQLLLNFGASPTARDKENGTVLHYAITQKNAPELIKLFSANGVNPDSTGWEGEAPLMVAIRYFHEVKPFDQSFRLGEDNTESGYDGPDPAQTLEALMAVGGNINIRDAQGNTPLMVATVLDDTKLVGLLLDLGADKTVRSPDGKTAMDMAYEMGHRAIFQKLE